MSRRVNPLLRLDLQRWRMRLMLGVLFAGYAALSARAMYLQGWQDEFLQEKGDARINRLLTIPAYRGMITDRRGEPLAISTPVESVWFNPRESEATPEQVAALAGLLDLDLAALNKLFKDKSKSFVYLRRQLPPDVAAAALALGIKGLYTKPEYRRYYPSGEVVAHVLGLTSVEDKGVEGAELVYQKLLAGEPGLKRVAKDRRGNVVEVLESVKLPRAGQDLALSLNLQIQYLAYRELAAAVQQNKARAGAVVVLDAKTGEILALANLPSYNPNNRSTMSNERARNRAATDAFEPGSTMKPFLVASALEAGVVRPETRIDTGAGYLTVGDKTIKDVHPKGNLTVAEALQVSSNVAMAKIVLEMRSEDYWRTLNRAGFGAPPYSGLPGESSGRLRPYDSWRPIEKATMAFGHGISVSLLQLAHAYTVFANDGWMPPLTIAKRREAVVGQRILAERTAREVRSMLELVTQDGGTAPLARVIGYRVAGKTGTAHKLIGGSYSPDKYLSSFVGMAPASDPRLIIAVMVDEPSVGVYYGGQIAAPVFSRIMAGSLRLMAVPPDAPMEASTGPNATAPVVAEGV
ncbi:MAG: penicillin-binding protein 2 [Hydrogenophilaceae bacterium]|nr:penicillin-binding protein 2 [Hydrogenophilaceae bacterium]